MRRRELLVRSAFLPLAGAGLVAGLAPGVSAPARAEDGSPFDGATVRNLARNLAQQPFKAADAPLPEPLTKLGYQVDVPDGETGAMPSSKN